MKRKFGIELCLLSLVAGVSLSGLTLAGQEKGAKINQGEKKYLDQVFGEKAAKAGLAEVKLGQLGSQRASNPDVKKFAERMAQDHTTANNELMKVASKQNVKLPDVPSKKGEEAYAKLSKLQVPDFDREFMT